MKALITGGSGFIGSHVVDTLLEHGDSVRFFSRKPELPERLHGKDVELFEGDLENFTSVVDALEGIDVFYHVGEIKNKTKAAAKTNIKLMEHIVENVQTKKVGRLVFVSSIGVAGIPSEIPASEDTSPDIVLGDHYTSYKRICEELIRRELSATEYSIIRPAPVYGPRSRYLGRLVSGMKIIGPVGIPFPGNGENLMPLIQVRDLAEAIYLAGIKSEAHSHVFNISDGLSHSWAEFLKAIGSALNGKVKIVPIPPLLLRFPSIFIDLFSPLFGIELDLKNYTFFFSHDIMFTNRKAQTVLGWTPRHADLNEGVKEMVKAYLKY